MSKARDLANAGTALGAVDATELGYLDGVTSAVQTQINSKIGSASAINPTIVDAKGDIVAATAADTVARLAVGTNGQVLTAASGQATGLEWATPAAGGMTLLSTTTLTGASTTISSISQAYNYLYIVINQFSGSADAYLRIAPNGSAIITNYVALMTNNTPTNASNAYWLPLHTNELGSAASTGNIAMNIYNYTSTTSFKSGNSLASFYNSNSASDMGNFLFTAIETTSAITSLTFSMSTGNLDAGSVLIYGVK